MVQARGLFPTAVRQFAYFCSTQKCVGVKNLTHNRCEDMSLCIIRSIDHRFLRLEAACVPCFDYLLHEIVVDGSEMRPRRIRSFSSYCPWGLMTTRRISNEAGLTINH